MTTIERCVRISNTSNISSSTVMAYLHVGESDEALIQTLGEMDSVEEIAEIFRDASTQERHQVAMAAARRLNEIVA